MRDSGPVSHRSVMSSVGTATSRKCVNQNWIRRSFGPEYDGLMGCRSTLEIGNVFFGSWKSGVDDSIMVLFSECEKLIQRIAPDTDCGHASEESESSPLMCVQYVTTVKVLKRRLDFLGFTLETCLRAFEIAKAQEIVNLRKRIEDYSWRSDDLGANRMIEHWSRRAELLSKSDAESWVSALREAFLAATDADPEHLSELARSVLDGATSEASSFVPGGTRFWFPGEHDERFRLRLELEALQDGKAVLDISDLVDEGYYSPSDPLASWSREWISAKERQALHIIVLTEGSTDKFVLESALSVLRPELTEYISFMDFAAFRVEGGASFLASMVRSFAGARIRDRIVAVFDNDTAGCAAECALSKHCLPENIKVMRYPDIELARNYPTLGPSGKVAMDVNGSGASIELYLGCDLLAEPSGELVPVQWRGIDPNMKRYQGEVLDKRGCRRRFLEKLNRLRRSKDGPELSEWKDLEAIMDAICSAFAVTDRDSLLKLASDPEGDNNTLKT